MGWDYDMIGVFELNITISIIGKENEKCNYGGTS